MDSFKIIYSTSDDLHIDHRTHLFVNTCDTAIGHVDEDNGKFTWSSPYSPSKGFKCVDLISALGFIKIAYQNSLTRRRATQSKNNQIAVNQKALF